MSLKEQQTLVPKESTTQWRFKKSCEALCNKIRKFNPQLYHEFKQITLNSKNGGQTKDQIKIQQRLDYLKQTQELFSTYEDYSNDLFKLLNKINNQNKHITINNLELSRKASVNEIQQKTVQQVPLNQEQQLEQEQQEYKLDQETSKFQLVKTQKLQKNKYFQFQQSQYYQNKYGQNNQKYEQDEKEHKPYQGQQIKTDPTLLANIEILLGEQKYQFFIKMLHIYTECIITCQEFLEIIQNMFVESPQIQEKLIEFSESRQISRRKINQNFKPLSDMDFQNSERYTHSYVAMPQFYPKHCSNSTELSRQNLNTKIISIPLGSEHSTFQICSKTQWEDALFKSEDEKYEFDINMMQLKFLTKTLEKISEIKSFQTDENKSQVIEKKFSKLIQSLEKQTILQFLYKENYSEIMEYLKSEPTKASAIVLEYVMIKYNEIQNIFNNNFKNNWHKLSEKNFYRSLDHRCFYFKKHDKKMNSTSKMERESEYRFNLINQEKYLLNKQLVKKSEEFDSDIKIYFQISNSFEGVNNIEKCYHNNQNKLKEFNTETQNRKQNNPFLITIFDQVDICQDTFALMIYYVQNFAIANYSQKSQMKYVMNCILSGIFNIQNVPFEFDTSTISEQKLINICKSVNSKIYEKKFAIFSEEDGDVQQTENNQISQSLKITQQENSEDSPEHENKQYNDDNNHNIEINLDQNSGQQENYDNKTKGLSNKNNNNNCVSQTILTELKNNERNLDTNNNNIFIETNNNNNDKVKINNIEDERYENFLKNIKVSNKNNTIFTTIMNENLSKNSQNEENDPLSNWEDIGQRNDSIIDYYDLEEFLDSSDEEEGVKQMNFKNNVKPQQQQNLNDSQFKFFPQQEEKSLIFYGTKYSYIFLRLFYIIYERMLKAKQMSLNINKNSASEQLDEPEKENIKKLRYETFKQILIFSLRKKDQIKYEDMIRCIFGEESFLLTTIDKLLISASKTLNNFINDDLSQKILDKYVKQMHKSNKFVTKQMIYKPDEVQFAKVNKMVLEEKAAMDQALYRFYIDTENQIVYFNFFNMLYHSWNKKKIEFQSQYLENYLKKTPLNQIIQSQQKKIFLNRNKSKTVKFLTKQGYKQYNFYFQINNIDYQTSTDNLKIIPCINNQEDIIITKSKLQRASIPLEQIICLQSKKVFKFNNWVQNLQKEIIQTPEKTLLQTPQKQK